MTVTDWTSHAPPAAEERRWLLAALMVLSGIVGGVLLCGVLSLLFGALPAAVWGGVIAVEAAAGAALSVILSPHPPVPGRRR